MYTIDPKCKGIQPFPVYCDMQGGTKWTVFQRRRDGSEDFYRGWDDYVNGFGDKNGEHWLGLKYIHCLTSLRASSSLRVEIADFNGAKWHASYSFFSVGNNATNYRLNIGGYTGNAGDALAYHNEMMFTTKDRDNDNHQGLQCAHFRRGGYWYNRCAYSNLNGLYLSGQYNLTGVTWTGTRSGPSHYSFKCSEMKLYIQH